jgi:hypothetical protein
MTPRNETFRDGRGGTLESDLERIVAAFVAAVPHQRVLRAERETAERVQQNQEQCGQLERDRIRKEKEFVEALLSEAENARRFRILRSYLEQLEQCALRDGPITKEGRLWLSTVRRLVLTYDPAATPLSSLTGDCSAEADEE